jgi:predicted TIM-barrel fold metal-dependent hydrolase
MQPGRPPASELFRRQCVISTEAEDGCLAATIARVGADHVLWASDFPHPDARFPDAGSTFLRTCGEQGLALRDVTDMLWTTPISFYLLADRFAPPVR